MGYVHISTQQRMLNDSPCHPTGLNIGEKWGCVGDASVEDWGSREAAVQKD